MAETTARAAAAFATHAADLQASARVVALAEAALKGAAPSTFVWLTLVTGILLATMSTSGWWGGAAPPPGAVAQAPTQADPPAPKEPVANPGRHLSLSGHVQDTRGKAIARAVVYVRERPASRDSTDWHPTETRNLAQVHRDAGLTSMSDGPSARRP